MRSSFEKFILLSLVRVGVGNLGVLVGLRRARLKKADLLAREPNLLINNDIVVANHFDVFDMICSFFSG